MLEVETWQILITRTTLVQRLLRALSTLCAIMMRRDIYFSRAVLHTFLASARFALKKHLTLLFTLFSLLLIFLTLFSTRKHFLTAEATFARAVKRYCWCFRIMLSLVRLWAFYATVFFSTAIVLAFTLTDERDKNNKMDG